MGEVREGMGIQTGITGGVEAQIHGSVKGRIFYAKQSGISTTVDDRVYHIG